MSRHWVVVWKKVQEEIGLRLAKIKNGRVWVNPKLTGDARKRVTRHMKVFKQLRKKGCSRHKAIMMARKAEHKGMTKKQIHRYEGKLGALARYGRRKDFEL